MSNAAEKHPEPRERTVQDALAYAESIIDTVRDPLLVLDADLRVRSASRSFYEDFRVKPEETEGRLVYELGNGQWDIPELRTLLEAILPENDSFRDFEVTHDFEGIGRRRMLLNARKVRRPGNHSELILLAIEDVTPTWRPGVDFAANRERYRVIVEGAIGLRHLHVRHRGRHHELERRGRGDARLQRGRNPRPEFLDHLHARGHRDPPGGQGDADRGGRGPGPR